MAEARFDWTERAIDILTTMRAAGDSFGTIARALGTTRNSCIGKASRLGPTKERQRKATKPKIALSPPVAARVPRPMPSAPEPAPRRELPDLPARVSFFDLKSWHCRFIPGRPNGVRTLYCGDVTAPGEPYCGVHREVCWQGPPPKGLPKAMPKLPRKAA